MIRAPIETSLSTKNSRLSNIFSKMRIVPYAWVATVTAIDVRSAGNAGHTPLSIFGICPPKSSSTQEPLARRHADARVRDLHLDAELPERRDDRDEIVRLDVRHDELAARRRGEADERRDLDVVRADAVVAPAERRLPRDVQDVRADALDLCADRDEEAAEILDVRLAGGVAEDGLAFGEHGGHDRVLRPHDGRLVEVHPRPT